MQSKIAVLQVIPNLDVSGASQGCIDIANHLEQENLVSFIVTNGGVNAVSYTHLTLPTKA